MRMRFALKALVVLTAIGASGGASGAQDPLPKLVAAGKSTCFRRVYDAAHLRQYPAQRTTSLLASLDYSETNKASWLRVRFIRKGRSAPADVMAGCDWSEQANIDTSGHRMMTAFHKDAGSACIAIYNASSAEEAGTIVFDLADDGTTLTLYFDSQIGLWTDADADSGGRSLDLGRDDRIFLLRPTNPAECSGLSEAMRYD